MGMGQSGHHLSSLGMCGCGLSSEPLDTHILLTFPPATPYICCGHACARLLCDEAKHLARLDFSVLEAVPNLGVTGVAPQ